jgi:Protein of unknown function (DUF1552)
MKTQKPSRRHFLRGTGAVLAIPLLESLVSREARAALTPQRRILFVMQGAGTLRDEWAPPSTPALQLPYILSGLEPMKSRIVVVGGIDNHVAVKHIGGGHNIANTTVLTGVERTDARDAQGMLTSIGASAAGGGPSIDELIASQLPMAPRRSVNIGVDTGGFATNFTAANTPAGNINLSQSFNELFGNLMGTTTPEVRERRRRTKESIIDSVLENFRRVNNRVSLDDKRKLDQHMSTLRDLEVRLALEAQGGSCVLGTPPALVNGVPYTNRLAYTYALAFSCGLTHVGSFFMQDSDAVAGFPVKYGGDYHNWIHQGADNGLDPVKKREDWRATMRWNSVQFNEILEKFQNTPDINGTTLLDNSAVVWLNMFGSASVHDFYEIPVVIGGNAGGAIRTGRFLDYRNSRAANPTISGSTVYKNQTTNNLCLSLAHAMGLNFNSFGDPQYSTGGLPGLVA